MDGLRDDVQKKYGHFCKPAGIATWLSAFVFLFALSAIETPVKAHGGRAAADGCHNDRKNGGRHCHGGNAAPRAKRSSSGSTYYPNCSAARAAGAAPVKRGQPGYASHLDRDNDGIGCE
tara:strand:- start:7825 stop:8181 length:357 start_codon:yes stop_codon:yes gene_type:complete